MEKLPNKSTNIQKVGRDKAFTIYLQKDPYEQFVSEKLGSLVGLKEKFQNKSTSLLDAMAKKSKATTGNCRRLERGNLKLTCLLK